MTIFTDTYMLFNINFVQQQTNAASSQGLFTFERNKDRQNPLLNCAARRTMRNKKDKNKDQPVPGF